MTSRDPEPNVLVEGMVLCYSTWAHVLFDLGASRSFMSTSFASIMDLEIAPLSCLFFCGDTYCHAPDPGPTRLANPNRFWGAKPYTGTPFFFFSELDLYLWYTNNFCNDQQSFIFTNELPPEWYLLKFIHIY